MTVHASCSGNAAEIAGVTYHINSRHQRTPENASKSAEHLKSCFEFLDREPAHLESFKGLVSPDQQNRNHETDPTRALFSRT